MNFPLAIVLLLLPPCLLFSTGKLIAIHSEDRGYSVHPQQGKSGNILDIIAGDTRTMIGIALVEKADTYYHGGLADHGDCTVTTVQDGNAHRQHDDHHAPKKKSAWHDPFKHLNSQLQSQAHNHLELNKAEELLPWYWAACEASPHNIQALEAAAYALAHMAEKPQEALQLLEKGIQNNPYDVTLEISRGEILINHFKNFKMAEVAFRAAYEKSLRGNAPRDDMVKAKVLFYLGHIAKQRNDLSSLQHWQQIARETMSPDLLSIRNLLEIH